MNEAIDSLWCFLPYPVLYKIFQHLSYQELNSAGQVCKFWNEVSLDELLWKQLFFKHFLVDQTIPVLSGRNWYNEFKRLCYHIPVIETETLLEHGDQVLHVSFSHNGKYFATCSKDGYVILWTSKYPAKVKYIKNMKSFKWKYTQYSQFNESDSLLLVSGVHFGTIHSNSGEIAVFNLDDFELQCRVVNKPYDIFGTWYSDQYLLSGDIHWLAHLVSSSYLWLNKASQEAESELVPITHCLYRFYNRQASSIRSIMVANCLSKSENVSGFEKQQQGETIQSREFQGNSSQHGNPVSHNDISWLNCDARVALHNNIFETMERDFPCPIWYNAQYRKVEFVSNSSDEKVGNMDMLENSEDDISETSCGTDTNSHKMSSEANVQRLNKDLYQFEIVDYVVFSSMLVLSALTGLYYGCRSKYCKSEEGQTLSEYLTGNRNLKPFPVALSLIASYVSGVTILGTPSDVYLFGTQYWLIVISIWISGFVVSTVYLPVFLKLRVNSSYEYLELRFSTYVRTIVSVFFVLDEVMFLPIIIYVPSLAFNQVTGINIHLIGTIVAIVCVFYTFLGGLRAVVWTDSWQVIAMFVSVVVVVILGSISVGGLGVIIDLSSKGNRFEFFNFNSSMYERYTFYSVIFGGFCYWTCFNSVNQTMVQRYLSLPTERQSKISVLIFTIGVSGFVFICCYAGILVYATYYGCDPLSMGRIKADDQILPLFVMETVGHLRGVPGLFIAGVFGAALSSLSVVLNSTAQVFLEDFLKGCMKMTLSERVATIVVKVVILVLGLVAVGFLYVVEHMGGVLAMASSLSAIAAAVSCGVFTLGMLIPWANSYGAIAGALTGAVMSGLVSFGGQFASAAKLVEAHRLPVFVNDSCFDKYGISNSTIITPMVYPDESDIFPLFRLSFLWITPIGVSSVLLVGVMVSLLTGKTDLGRLDPELISPVAQWMLPAKAQRYAGSAIRKARNREVVENEVMVQVQTIALGTHPSQI